MPAVLLLIGFLFLYFGAEWLVRGASRLSILIGLSPLLIGITVVAFGTSLPELLVSLISAIKGKDMIAVGNVVGSNICNIALILGISSLFHPISCQKEVVKRDIPIMIFISIFLIIISLDSRIDRIDGFLLFSGLIGYTIFNYLEDKKKKDVSIDYLEELGMEEEEVEKGNNLLISKQIILVLAGIFFVVFGAKIVVNSAESLMRILGISEKVIGLTVVAFGTSLPELATSAVAAYRRHMDISLGNIIGSNAFNIMCVLGLTSLIRPIEIKGGVFKSGLFIDYLIMLSISITPYVMARGDLLISRKNGLFLLFSYMLYVIYLFSSSRGFASSMSIIGIPSLIS